MAAVRKAGVYYLWLAILSVFQPCKLPGKKEKEPPVERQADDCTHLPSEVAKRG